METNETELLQQLLHTTQKQLKLTRIIAVACVVLAVLSLITFAVLVPRVMTTLNDMNTMAGQLAQVNWAEIAENVNSLVTEVQPGMAEITQALSALDFASLNKAIQDLQAVIAPLAKFFGK